MSASLNLVTLIGNLTADPELKETQSGTARARFSIAINRKWKNSSGQLQDETTYVPIVVWDNNAKNCAKYIGKGRSVAVVGRLRIDSFENAEGERKKVVEVVATNVQFLGGNPTNRQSDAAEPAQSSTAPSPTPSDVEEVPF